MVTSEESHRFCGLWRVQLLQLLLLFDHIIQLFHESVVDNAHLIGHLAAFHLRIPDIASSTDESTDKQRSVPFCPNTQGHCQ